MKRAQINKEQIDDCLGRVRRSLELAFQKKGQHILVSNHEILGVVTEEYYELIDAVKSNSSAKVYGELVDLLVAALVGILSIKSGKMDS